MGSFKCTEVFKYDMQKLQNAYILLPAAALWTAQNIAYPSAAPAVFITTSSS